MKSLSEYRRGFIILLNADNRPGTMTAPADVAYTIYEAVGVNPHGWLQHPEGRPVEILDQGEAIRELF